MLSAACGLKVKASSLDVGSLVRGVEVSYIAPGAILLALDLTSLCSGFGEAMLARICGCREQQRHQEPTEQHQHSSTVVI